MGGGHVGSGQSLTFTPVGGGGVGGTALGEEIKYGVKKAEGSTHKRILPQ